MITLAVKLGFGQELSSIDAPNVPKIIMHDYLAQTFGLAGGAMGRISFIVFVVGLLVQKRSHRIILWILVGLQLVVNCVFIIILFVQCPGHASAIWDHSGRAKCWDPRVQAYYSYFQGCKLSFSRGWSSRQFADRPHSVQLCHRSIPCCVFDMYILESEAQNSSESRACCSTRNGNIVSISQTWSLLTN